jgi:hypothetical protein
MGLHKIMQRTTIQDDKKMKAKKLPLVSFMLQYLADCKIPGIIDEKALKPEITLFLEDIKPKIKKLIEEELRGERWP